jgi:hypothetical protein
VPPGYLKHYLIDFAASLGSGTTRPHEPREGSEYNVDLWASLARVFTLGFYDVGWEDREWDVIDPTIGWLDGENFDPGGWKPNWPNRAFQLATDRDGYWGAKLVGSFSDEQIRAAVEAGRLPDRRAADTLAAILITRRDLVVDHWYRKVSPLENFVVVTAAGGRSESALDLEIRFDDLGLEAGLWKPEDVSYRWELEHAELDRDWNGTTVPRPDGSRSRIRLTPARSEEESSPGALPLHGGQELARLKVSVEHTRDGVRQRPVTVWLEWSESTDSYRVAGLEH